MKVTRISVYIFLVIISIQTAIAKKVVFLGDSNTALTYLNPKNNQQIRTDYRFTSLIQNPETPYFIPGLTSVNSAVGGATTKDFLRTGKYYSNQTHRGWDKTGDFYVICFGLNDAPAKLNIFQNNSRSHLLNFERQSWELIKLIKAHSPRAKIFLMTNVPVNFEGGDFQYDRDFIIDSYDAIYRKMSKSKILNLIDTNRFLKNKIYQGNSDLRIRRYKNPVLNSSMDNSHEARRLGRRLWRTNIHYNINGSSLVAELLRYSIR